MRPVRLNEPSDRSAPRRDRIRSWARAALILSALFCGPPATAQLPPVQEDRGFWDRVLGQLQVALAQSESDAETESDAGTVRQPETGSQQDDATIDLPSHDRDGRPLRPIGIYQSQLIDLVPKGFRAVPVDEIRRAIETGDDRVSQADRPRLISGFYDIRLDTELLVSERSELVLEHRPGKAVQKPLGMVNLAILDSFAGASPPVSTAALNLPRLEIDETGSLIAVIPGARKSEASSPRSPSAEASAPQPDSAGTLSPPDWVRSQVRFRWTLRSQPLGQMKKFDIRLPRTSQTRMVISTPSDVRLESLQGVLVESPGPPPDADVQTRSGDIRWYVLEAGGLHRIELLARRTSAGESDRPILVRRESKQYEVDLSGVSWVHRMTMELPQQQTRLRLRASRGTVTDIRVDSQRTEYQVLRRGDDESIVDVPLPRRRDESSSVPTSDGADTVDRTQPTADVITLTIEGVARWDLARGDCELPVVLPEDDGAIWTESSTQMLVRVLDPLEVVRWELPAGWKQSLPTSQSPGESTLVAEGPPTMRQWRREREPELDGGRAQVSRLRLLQKQSRFVDRVWNRMALQDAPVGVVRSTVRIRFRMLENDLSPMVFDVNPDWTLDSVKVIDSERQVPVPGSVETLTIWPTSEEAERAMIDIEISAHQTIPRSGGPLSLPSTWTARPQGHLGDQLVAIHPPKLRRWSASSILLPTRVESDSLDGDELAFFDPTLETLLLRSPTGEVPRLRLAPIDVSIGISLKHSLGTQGDELTESIVIRAETTRPVPELSVLTGDAGYGPFEWSLRRKDETATINLPDAQVTRNADDPLGTYVIRLEGRDLADYDLIGRRVFDALDELVITLPSVRGANSQSAESSIDPQWETVDLPQGVQLVPGGATLGPNDSPPGRTSGDPANRLQSQHLRYDPLMRPKVRLRRVRTETRTCLVWDQLLEAVVSSRGEDQFHLLAQVSSQRPIQIAFDDALSLDSITRNGKSVSLDRIEAGLVRVSPEQQTDGLSLRFRRRHQTIGMMRRCKIPLIRIDGHVVRQRATFRGGTGTIIASTSGPAESFEPGEASSSLPTELLLVPRNVAIAAGWFLAGTAFCLAWIIARWIPMGIHGLFVVVVVATCAAIIWWPWQSAIIGWTALPIATGALLSTVLHASTRRIGKPGGSERDDTRSQRDVGDGSVDFSVTLPKASICLAVILSAAAATGGQAQSPLVGPAPRESNSDSGPRGGDRTALVDPIEILVPLGKQHDPVGDKVYLSEADYESITSVLDPDRAIEATFLSAEYRVILSPPRDVSEPAGAEIEADFLIRLARESTRVRLPFRADTLRRIEILSDDDSQIARFVSDERAMVIANVPPGLRFRIRCTFVPSISAESDTRSSADPSPTAATGPDAVPAAQLDVAADAAQPFQFEDREPRSLATTVRLAIPPIHSANLVVEAPRELSVDSLGNPLGRTLYRPELGRYEADLGPISELVVTCRPNKRLGSVRAQTLRRAYRIVAGIENTIVECEIHPDDRVAEGEIIPLTVIGPPPTSLNGNGWAFARSEANGVADRPAAGEGKLDGVYRFVKQSDVESPIRLLWQFPSVINDPTSTDDSAITAIPEVFATSVSRQVPTLFAIESAPSIRISETVSESQPVSTDAFQAAWNGYPGKIDRAFFVESTFPTFVLLQEKFPQRAITLQHRLHIAPSKMYLSLSAEIVDLNPSLRRALVTLPPMLRLTKCLVNGKPSASITPLSFDRGEGEIQTALSLGDQRIDGVTKIELSGELTYPGRGERELPRFEIASDAATSESYRITRDRSLSVEVIEGEGGPVDDSASAWDVSPLTRSDLLAGTVPVAQSETGADARVRVRRRPGGAVFACDQTTLMRYSGGQWICYTLLELPAGQTPDFVDLEMPTRWTTDLSVEGASIWGKRVSSDSSITVLRVAVADESPPDSVADPLVRRVLITGGLDNRDQVRVGVPDVGVLGAGRRQHIVAVPDRLTTEDIQWRPQGVNAISPRQDWSGPIVDKIESPENYSLYEVDRANWSIELEPLAQAAVEPSALACDAKVILEHEHVLVYQRFDLLPETLNQIVIAFPPATERIGIWSAGREVDVHDVPRPDSLSRQDAGAIEKATRIRVPLTYSRLPQSLEVLFRVPTKDRTVDEYLCQLIGISTASKWVEYYRSPNQAGRKRLRLNRSVPADSEEVASLAERRSKQSFALAESVVTAIDRSRDMLAERSDEEIERWLFPWVRRYQTVAIRAGHRFRFETEDAESTSPPVEGVVPAPVQDNGSQIGSERRWQMLDNQILQLAGRFLQSNPQIPQPLFSRARLAGFELVDVQPLDSLGDPIPIVQSFVARESLQQVLANAITLVTFALGVVLLWPFRGRYRHWIFEPSTWLFILGFVTLWIIPPPIAVMLMVVAVSIPIINRRTHRRTVAGA